MFILKSSTSPPKRTAAAEEARLRNHRYLRPENGYSKIREIDGQRNHLTKSAMSFGTLNQTAYVLDILEGPRNPSCSHSRSLRLSLSLYRCRHPSGIQRSARHGVSFVSNFSGLDSFNIHSCTRFTRLLMSPLSGLSNSKLGEV